MTPKTYAEGLHDALTACMTGGARTIGSDAHTVGECAGAIEALINAQSAGEPRLLLGGGLVGDQAAVIMRLQRILDVERGLNPPEGWARMGRAWYHAATTTWVRAEDQAIIRWAWWRYGEDDSTISARGSADTALEAIEAAEAHLVAGM